MPPTDVSGAAAPVADAVVTPPAEGTGADVTEETNSADGTDITETADPPEPAKDKEADAAAKAEEEKEAAKKAQADRFAKAKAAAERYKKVNAQNRQLREYNMNAQREIEQREQAAQRESARAEAAEAQLKAMREDPLGHLEKFGVDAKSIGQKLVDANTPEAKIALLEERLAKQEAEYRQRAEAAEKAEAEARQRVVMQQARDSFVKMAASDEHPALARITKIAPDTILREGEAIFQDIAVKNQERARQRLPPLFYTDQEVLQYLNTKYAALFENGDTPKAVAAAQQQGSAGTVETALGTGAKETTAGARPLTNRAATQKTSLPPNIDDMSPEEANKAMANWLRANRG